MSIQSSSTALLPSQKKKRKKNSFLSTVRKFWFFYIMMLPAIIILILNNYIPMLGVLIAFKNVNYAIGILDSPWVGFDNFKYLFSTSAAWIITRNTVAFNAVFILLNLVAGVGFALMFNEMRNKFLSKFHQSVMFLPYFLSYVVVSYLAFAFLSGEHGFLNVVLFPKLGIDPVEWYTTPHAWIFILPIVALWKNIGYFTVIYMAAMVGIDHEYYEAAIMEGATKLQRIRSITLPLIAPVIIVMTLLQIGRIFYGDFGLFFQVTKNAGSLYDVTNVIDVYVYQTFLSNGDIAMSSAAGLYQAIVGFVLVLGSNLIVRRFSKENALF